MWTEVGFSTSGGTEQPGRTTKWLLGHFLLQEPTGNPAAEQPLMSCSDQVSGAAVRGASVLTNTSILWRRGRLCILKDGLLLLLESGRFDTPPICGFLDNAGPVPVAGALKSPPCIRTARESQVFSNGGPDGALLCHAVRATSLVIGHVIRLQQFSCLDSQHRDIHSSLLFMLDQTVTEPV